MAKKILQNEKNTSKDIKDTSEDVKNVDMNFYQMKQFNFDICKLKHAAIDKELKNIETNNSKKYEEDDKKHEELMGIIQNFQKNVKEDIENVHTRIKEDNKKDYNNLKDKIILTEKIIGGKIDKLNEFDDSLKGNGHPGIWESIRILKWKYRISAAFLVIIFILVLGGDIRGITIDKIKKCFGIDKQVETKQVEEKEIKQEESEFNMLIKNKRMII